MGLEQGHEQLAREQRRIAREDEHLVRTGDRMLGTPHRVARPERLSLHRDVQPLELVRGVGRDDDDERIGAERPRRLDDPVDHPAAEDRVQVLRGRREHACPPASGHHNGCKLGAAGFGHGRHVGWGARIRTWDHGTKARCLTTWPRPSESGRRVYPDARSPRVLSRVTAGRGAARSERRRQAGRPRGPPAHRRARCRRARGRR